MEILRVDKVHPPFTAKLIGTLGTISPLQQSSLGLSGLSRLYSKAHWDSWDSLASGTSALCIALGVRKQVLLLLNLLSGTGIFNLKCVPYLTTTTSTAIFVLIVTIQ